MKSKLKKVLCALAVGVCTLLPQMTEAAAVEDVIYSNVAQYNGDAEEALWITEAICYASAVYQVDPLLITAVMENESSFSLGAYSPVGAIGLMQLMPGTADSIGVDPYNPLGNVLGGTSYLRMMLDDFAGYGDYAVTDAVAAYNAGPQAVYDYGGCPPYAETQNYVINVADSYNRLLNAYSYGY